MTTTALITGASSGIGRDLAFIHAARGGDVVLVARREDRLNRLAAEIIDKYKVDAIVLTRDLAAPGVGEEVHREITARGITIDHLLNNAGFGQVGRFTEIEPDRHAAMINLNVLALTQLTRAFLPEMIARGRGQVLNVASTAAFVPGPSQAVYFATKAYVLSLTEALAVELEGTGVTVTALCPGATASEFADNAGAARKRMFASAAPSADVAEYGYEAMLRGETVAIHGRKNRMLPPLLRVIPRKTATRISKRVMERE